MTIESITDTCPGCAQPIEATDRYCECCGISPNLRRTPEGGPVDPTAATPRDRMTADLTHLAGVSDRGGVRRRNEDSMALASIGPSGRPHAGVAVVCDGVASTDDADSASQTAVDAALGELIDIAFDGHSPAGVGITEATAAAYRAVAALAPPDRANGAPSCTLLAAVVTNTEITVGWIGDSRAYWLCPAPEQPSRLLTRDDTVVARLVAEGVDPAIAARRRGANALERWIGGDAVAGPPNLVTLRPTAPGWLVLCSDGLWNHLPDPAAMLAATPAGSTPAGIAHELTEFALRHGGNDNITVVALSTPLNHG